jgi:hypothetical protein
VAQALQRPAGSVSVRYTVPAALAPKPRIHAMLMRTPYEDVLAALTLDTKGNLRFVRTGSRAEGARVALVNVADLIAPHAHWDIALEWDEEHLALTVRDKDAPGGRALYGRWPRA